MHHGGGVGGAGNGGKSGERDIPKVGALNRLKNAPKDQIPISKAPRRQKSSRFYVTEKVQLEPTPAFHGKHIYIYKKFVDMILISFLFYFICRGTSSFTP